MSVVVISRDIDPDSEEGKRLNEKLDRALNEAYEYIRKHGGKSAVGFVRTPKGPRSISEED